MLEKIPPEYKSAAMPIPPVTARLPVVALVLSVPGLVAVADLVIVAEAAILPAVMAFNFTWASSAFDPTAVSVVSIVMLSSEPSVASMDTDMPTPIFADGVPDVVCANTITSDTPSFSASSIAATV